MRDHGYIEGQNLTIEWRSAEGRAERIPDLAAELIRLNVDVIVTSGDDVTGVLMRSTKTVPIVMATSGDPVASGYVASLARPGGNITGLSGQLRELPVKRLQLLKAMLPTAQRLGHLTRPDRTIAEAVLAEGEIEDATQALDMVRAVVRVRDARERCHGRHAVLHVPQQTAHRRLCIGAQAARLRGFQGIASSRGGDVLRSGFG